MSKGSGGSYLYAWGYSDGMKGARAYMGKALRLGDSYMRGLGDGNKARRRSIKARVRR